LKYLKIEIQYIDVHIFLPAGRKNEGGWMENGRKKLRA